MVFSGWTRTATGMGFDYLNYLIPPRRGRSLFDALILIFFFIFLGARISPPRFYLCHFHLKFDLFLHSEWLFFSFFLLLCHIHELQVSINRALRFTANKECYLFDAIFIQPCKGISS
jgi:hypothetical protein